MIRVILIMIGWFICHQSIAVNRDSLREIIGRDGVSRSKIEAMNALAWEIRNDDPELAQELLKEALILGENMPCVPCAAQAMVNQGDILQRERKLDTARQVYQQLFQYAIENHDTMFAVRGLAKIGITHYFVGALDTALSYYLDALGLVNEKSWEANLYNNIALVYKRRQDYPNAIKYYLLASEVYAGLGNLQRKLTIDLNLVSVYKASGQYERAMSMFKEIAHIAREHEFTHELARAYNRIAYLSLLEGDTLRAALEYDSAYTLFATLQDYRGMAIASGNKAEFLADYIGIDSSLNLQLIALDAFVNLGHKIDEAVSRQSIGRTYHLLGKTDEAIVQLDSAIALALALGDMEHLHKFSKNLAIIYAELGDHKKAYEYHVKYTNARDSILNEATSQEILSKELEHILAKRKEQEQREKRNNQGSIWGYAIVFLLALGVSLFVAFVLLKKRREGIKEAMHSTPTPDKASNDKVALLSKREKEVLIEMSSGLSDKEIAKKLFISVSTVRTHSRKIFEKLEVKNRVEASSIALKSSLLSKD